MKRPNITPGPWKTNKDPEVIADIWTEKSSSDGLRQFVAASPFCGDRDKMGREKARKQWACDAQAIAALPELLEAMERLFSIVEISNAGYGCPPWEREIVQAKAALEKAGYTLD